MKTILALAISAAAIIASSQAAFATPSAKVTLEAKSWPLPKDAQLAVKLVELEGGTVLSSSKIRAKKRFAISIPSEPVIVEVGASSFRGRVNLRGVSKKVLSSLPASKLSKALQVRLRSQSRAATDRLRRALAPATERATVGVPLDGIKLSGADAEAWMRRAQVQLLETALVQNSACYLEPNGFVLIALDPDVLAARQREFSLCSSGRADPATCVSDRFVPPSQLITGSLFVEGNEAVLTLQLSAGNGLPLIEVSAAGSLRSIQEWEDLTITVQEQLSDVLCGGGTLTVTSASCETPSCGFPCITGSAYRVQPTISGTARGPVGYGVSVSIGVGEGTLDCGTWSAAECDAILCCRRTADSQPNETTFQGVLNYGQGVCICPSGESATFDLVAQLTGFIPQEIERSVECPV